MKLGDILFELLRRFGEDDIRMEPWVRWAMLRGPASRVKYMEPEAAYFIMIGNSAMCGRVAR